MTQRFRTLIHQFKGLYSITLLFSNCALLNSGAFGDCFTSTKVVSCQQFCDIGELHSLLPTVDVDIFHDIGFVVK